MDSTDSPSLPGSSTDTHDIAGEPGSGTGLTMGLDTFGDMTEDRDGERLHPAQVLRNVVEEAVLADRLGVDAITLGEHHRDDFAISSPEIVLGAIAGRTERILLGTGVTVLSSDDPVRVYERFATLDGISNGRAEVVLGRGSFTESFPLFGYNLAHYDELFTEKLDLFTRLRSEGPVTWAGRHRSPLTEQEVHPKTERPGGVRAWVGVGGSPQSVMRSVHFGIPMMLAIIGGAPARFTPFVELYRAKQADSGATRCRSEFTPPATSPTATSRHAMSSGRTFSPIAGESGGNAAGPTRRARSSSTRSSTDRST